MGKPVIGFAFLAVFVGVYLKERWEDEARDPGAWDDGSMVLLLVLVPAMFLAFTWPEWPREDEGTGKPVLAVDLDEVCCAYLPAFIRYSNSSHGTDLTMEDFTSYYFWEVPNAKLNSRAEAQDRVYSFHKSRFYAQIEPMAGAKLALDMLKQNFDLHIVTSRATDFEAQTRSWVQEHFPDTFKELHFGNHFAKPDWRGKVKRVSKPDMCRKIGAVALIEDSLDYAKQCAAVGIPVFLFGNYAWNSSRGVALSPLITRVASWRMVAQVLTPQVIAEATGKPL